MLHLKDDMDVSSLTFLGTIAHILGPILVIAIVYWNWYIYYRYAGGKSEEFMGEMDILKDPKVCGLTIWLVIDIFGWDTRKDDDNWRIFLME